MEIKLDDYEKYVVDGLWTKAINKAIKDLNKGDTLIFSKNKTYISGTIFIKSDITFNLEENAILKASNNIDDMNSQGMKFDNITENTFINCDYNGCPYLYFIYGKDINNFYIKGKGTINGNEEIFYGEVTPTYIEGAFYPRMPLIYIENGKNIILNGITLTKSAFWTVHLVGCDGINIKGIKILNNRRMLNADGIDPDHSKNINIEDCYIESADDCIVLKGTEFFKKYGDTSNVLVKNCTLKSSSAAIKIGTETEAHFHNIHFENIKISDTNRGISIQLRDSGNIDNLTFDNLEINTHMFDLKAFWGKAEPIAITSVKRNDKTINGKISNIKFNNLKINSEHGITIYGNDNIFDITFNNLDITLNNETGNDKNIYDLRPGIIGEIKDKHALIYAVGANNINVNGFKYDLNNNESLITNGNIIITA